MIWIRIEMGNRYYQILIQNRALASVHRLQKKCQAQPNCLLQRHCGRNIGSRATDRITASDQLLLINEWLYVLRKPRVFLTSLKLEYAPEDEPCEDALTEGANMAICYNNDGIEKADSIEESIEAHFDSDEYYDNEAAAEAEVKLECDFGREVTQTNWLSDLDFDSTDERTHNTSVNKGTIADESACTALCQEPEECDQSHYL